VPAATNRLGSSESCSVRTITEYHCGVILPAPKFFVVRSDLDEECCMIAHSLRHTPVPLASAAHDKSGQAEDCLEFRAGVCRLHRPSTKKNVFGYQPTDQLPPEIFSQLMRWNLLQSASLSTFCTFRSRVRCGPLRCDVLPRHARRRALSRYDLSASAAPGRICGSSRSISQFKPSLA